MPNRAPQQSQSSNVSIVYVGYFAISLSRIATGLFKSVVMSSSAGVEDSLAQLRVNWRSTSRVEAGTGCHRRLGVYLEKELSGLWNSGEAVNNFSKALDRAFCGKGVDNKEDGLQSLREKGSKSYVILSEAKNLSLFSWS